MCAVRACKSGFLCAYPQGWRTTWGKPDRGPALARAGVPLTRGVLVARQDRPALARAGVPSGVWTRKCRGSASPGACGRSPDAGRAQAIPRHEGASFVSFLPLQQKIGHPPGTGASEASRGALRLPRESPRPRGVSEASRGALRLPRESPRHAGGIIPPSCSPRPDWGILRARAWARVVDTVRGLPTRTRVADIVRGLSTPRGGYNARSCQQRASVPITNVRAGGPRRRQVRRSRRPTGTAICLPQWVFSRSDAVGLTQEATAGRAMSTMVALNGRPGAPGRLLTHGPRRARAQSHRSRQFA